MIVLNKETVKLIIENIEGDQNKERKKRDFKSYQIFSGNQRDYIKSRLKDIFADSYHVFRVSNVNVLKKVVDKIGQAYEEPPKRMVDGKQNDNLDSMYSEGNFDDAFVAMDVGFNRSRCGLLWVQNDPITKTKNRLIYLNQFTFDVIINNDTLELEAVILSYPKSDITASVNTEFSDGVNQLIAEAQMDSANDATVYAMWTPDQHVNVVANVNKKTTTIDYIIDENNEDGKNDLGALPFVWLTNNPFVPEYPIENPLQDDSIEINILGSNLLTATQMQIGQLVLKYPKGSEIKTIHKGYTVCLELPQATENDPHIETTAEYIVPNSDLSGMKDVLMEYAASIMSDNGLEGASLAGENKTFASGFERLIASASVVKIQKKNQKYYSQIEKKVFDIVKKYDEINGTRLFGKDDKFSAQFNEPQVIKSEKDKLEIIEKRMDLNLDEEHEKFIIDSPNMTPTDAKAKLKRIKKEIEANTPTIEIDEPPMNENDDGDNEG